ncbi:tRNA (adenosine(37)-N6)-dimethylallyltransferase MiaA [Italian clover phyllody phytoplasma]|uniref:tRNA (adenosine(37)-N6)-dimethylallyltransferase MiaA n=1 Tax=Italian clover phyllody phytoplasma TaxID=1196420 RepID=UPI0002FBFDB9|nr:tRNA (adenosine(37)-N6)-dimethylallyltransferase MiaA [Italian clover phyllody phytoplasma]
MKKIIVIAGPTTSGKTALSIKLAQHFQGEIINADSVQIYQKFDIGSAKATLEEQNNIKHHLLNVISPKDCYNIYDFQKDVRKIIPQIDVPFLVGGSGLYIKAALFDYEFEGKAFPKNYLDEKTDIKQLLQAVKEKDPHLVLDENNPHRIISAYQHLNQSKLRSEKQGKKTPLFDFLAIYLDIDRKILKQRIILRLEQMLKKGFIEEVKILIKDYPQANFNIIGYREIKFFLEDRITLEEVKRLIISKTFKYAKRQKTWFKNQIKPLFVIDALSDDLENQAINIIEKFLKKESN